MGVQVIGAALAKQIVKNDGRLRLIDPAPMFTVAASERERLRLSGQGSLAGPMPDWWIYLALIGGEAKEYILTTRLVYPDGQLDTQSPLTIDRFTWSAGTMVFEHYLKMAGILAVKDSGIYEIRFLLDGEPLVGLKFPVIWEDDFDYWQAGP